MEITFGVFIQQFKPASTSAVYIYIYIQEPNLTINTFDNALAPSGAVVPVGITLTEKFNMIFAFIWFIWLSIIPCHIYQESNRAIKMTNRKTRNLCTFSEGKWCNSTSNCGHIKHGDPSTCPGLILGLRPANERRRYFVTTSLSLAERKPRISPVVSPLFLSISTVA